MSMLTQQTSVKFTSIHGVHVCYDAFTIGRYLHIGLNLNENMKKELNKRRKDISLAIVAEQLCNSRQKLEEEEHVFLGKFTSQT